MQKLRQQNVVHAEVYVSIGVIRWRGQPVEPIFEGMECGRERGQRDIGEIGKPKRNLRSDNACQSSAAGDGGVYRGNRRFWRAGWI